MYKKLLLMSLSIFTILGLTACNKLDVIGVKSVDSFEAVVEKMGDKVTADSEFGGWSLEAPDGGARLLWSSDYSKTTDEDVLLEIDAKPFLKAGLDVTKLPEGMYVEDKIIVGTKLGNDAINYEGDVTPLSSYEKIVDLYRNNITYHTSLDHYGIDLSNGNMFEWAKDMTTNDKDIVFVLNPEVFINAGADPNKIEGWIFAKVETMDKNMKKIEVDKLLKPFDLDGKPVK